MRLAAKIGSVDFEDVRINFPDWPALKPKTPFGQLPFMNIDDSEPIAQSGAMYVSRARMQTVWLSLNGFVGAERWKAQAALRRQDGEAVSRGSHPSHEMRRNYRPAGGHSCSLFVFPGTVQLHDGHVAKLAKSLIFAPSGLLCQDRHHHLYWHAASGVWIPGRLA